MSLKLLKETLPKKASRKVMGEGIWGGRIPRNSESMVDSQKARWRRHPPCQEPAGETPSGMGVEFSKELMEHPAGEVRVKIHRT